MIDSSYYRSDHAALISAESDSVVYPKLTNITSAHLLPNIDSHSHAKVFRSPAFIKELYDALDKNPGTKLPRIHEIMQTEST